MARPTALTSPTPPENALYAASHYRRYKHLIAFMKAVVEAAPPNGNTLRQISRAAGLDKKQEKQIRRLSAGMQVTGMHVPNSVVQKLSKWSGVSYEEFKKNAGPDDVCYAIPGTTKAPEGPLPSQCRYKHVIAFMQAVWNKLPPNARTGDAIAEQANVTATAVSRIRNGLLNRAAIRKISDWSGVSYQHFKDTAGPDDLFYATLKRERKPQMDTPTPPTTPSPVDTIAAGNPELRLLSAMVTYSVGISPAGIERALDWFRSYRGLDQPSGN
jgi:hypothetical protein